TCPLFFGYFFATAASPAFLVGLTCFRAGSPHDPVGGVFADAFRFFAAFLAALACCLLLSYSAMCVLLLQFLFDHGKSELFFFAFQRNSIFSIEVYFFFLVSILEIIDSSLVSRDLLV